LIRPSLATAGQSRRLSKCRQHGVGTNDDAFVVQPFSSSSRAASDPVYPPTAFSRKGSNQGAYHLPSWRQRDACSQDTKTVELTENPVQVAAGESESSQGVISSSFGRHPQPGSRPPQAMNRCNPEHRICRNLSCHFIPTSAVATQERLGVSIANNMRDTSTPPRQQPVQYEVHVSVSACGPDILSSHRPGVLSKMTGYEPDSPTVLVPTRPNAWVDRPTAMHLDLNGDSATIAGRVLI
jgi:hypothetical protein